MQRGMTALTPAATWRDGLPCGDGSLCALVYGGISPETILFNHERLWYGGAVKPLPDLRPVFQRVRELGYAGDLQAANDLMTRTLIEGGYQGLTPMFHPAFDLKLRSEQRVAFSHYRRSLNFETGEATVRWQQGEAATQRRFFISRRDHVGVLRVDTEESALSLGLQLCEHNLSDSFGMDMQARIPPLAYRTYCEGNRMILRVTGSGGGEYGAVLRLYPQGGQLRAFQDITWSEQTSSLPVMQGWELPRHNTVEVSGARSLCAVIACYAQVPPDQAEAEIARLSRYLEELGGDYDALLARHAAVHGELFGRLSFQVEDGSAPEDAANEPLLLAAYQGQAPARLLTKLFDYGRYLLICCSNERGLPPTLQGTFNGDYYPPWNSCYIHNENTQMFYWQALSGRMPEVMGALFGYLESFLPDYRANARNLFGCRGIFIPLVAAANTGLLQDAQPHVIHFTGCAAWLAAHFYDYYLYTGDEGFLRSHALPFMEEAARFYEDYLTLDQDGLYTIFPSNSPENAPGNSFPKDTDLRIVMNPGIPTTFNSTIDTALVRELLTNLVAAYNRLQIEPEARERYQGILDRLRPYRVNGDGALAEWIAPQHTDNYAHRHLSHIYPFFPGHEITAESAPELVEAVRVAVDRRLGVGLASQSGWSLVHLANIYARLGEGNRSLECLDILARTCVGQNLFTYHNDHRGMGVTLDIVLGRSNPYQIDANMGLTAAVIEMLMDSSPTALHICPALPDRWQSGRIATLAARCGCDCAISWAQGRLEVLLTARDTREIEVFLPEGYRTQGRQRFTLALERGREYRFTAQK